ncbi:MAG: hypothetical protein VW475_02130 [Curvibacter sp.]
MRALLYLLPGLLATLVCVGWAWQSATPAVVSGLLLLGSGLLLAWALGCALRPPVGQLAWDGQTWRWPSGQAAQPGAVRVRLDLQQALLLEFRPARGRGVWLWLERRLAPLHWDDLRRAVHADAGDTAGSPVAPEERA